MEENLKIKQNKFQNLKWFVLSAVLFINCTFIAAEENLSDEFFNAAMKVEASSQNINTVKNTHSVFTNLASPSEVNTVVNKNDFLNHSYNISKNFILNLTGHNIFAAKILIVILLVLFISLLIAFFIFFAKKFVFKKNNNKDANNLFNKPVNNVNTPKKTHKKNISKKIKQTKTKNKIEHAADNIDNDNINNNINDNISDDYNDTDINNTDIIENKIDTNYAENINVQSNIEVKPDTESIPSVLNLDSTLKIVEPKDIQSAMKIFLKITAI